MRLILIDNRIEVALAADSAGIDRVMVDLETIGKKERQGHLDTLISSHSVDDIDRIRALGLSVELMARVNPLGAYSRDEVDACLAAGAQRLMLPMFRTTVEAQEFIDIVADRSPVTLLVETPEAAARIRPLTRLRGVDEIHVGLNDLHLGFQLDFMFELFADGLVDFLAAEMRAANVRFGVGGVARIGHGDVDARYVLSELMRVGASQVILSRDYRSLAEKGGPLAVEIRRIRRELDELREASPSELAEHHERFVDAVHGVAMRKRSQGLSTGS